MSNEDNKYIEEELPEHIPVIPYDDNLERLKEERKKLEKKLRESGKKIEPIIITNNGTMKKVSQLTKSEQADEIIKCASDPIYLIETYFTVFDGTQGKGGMIVPFRLFEYQKDLIKTYQEERFVVANKYRQAGISTCTAAYLSWVVMFDENKTVAIVANKLETAVNEVMSDIVDFIDGCPDWMKPLPSKKNTQKLKIYDNGCTLAAFASKGFRGLTVSHLFWDETAWTEKGDIFWTSAAPTLQTGGGAIFVSCVTEDSFIFTNEGIAQIKDFKPKNCTLGPHIIPQLNILGANKTRTTNIFFNNGYVDTLKITTTCSELESSENHKYWAYKNGRYDWFKASELEVGDYVSIQYGMDIWGNNDDCSDFKPTESKSIRNHFKPEKITPDLAYFIGLYISEGCFRRIGYDNCSGQIVISCGDDISEIYGKLNIKYSCKDGMHYVSSSKNILEFFEYIGFNISKKAPQKTIPPRLLKMSKENIVAMIQGIMDGDGWASYDENRNGLKIGIGLSSLELIKQLRIIFSNFGILSEYKEYLTPVTEKVKVESIQHRLTTSNFNAKLYHEKIGFRLKRKNDVAESFDVNKLKHKGVTDNIPNGSDIVKQIYEEIKFYGMHNFLKEHNINVKDVIQSHNGTVPVSRKTILMFINLFKDKISKELINDKIINENITWRKIKSIEKSKNWTYDFSMGSENEKEDNEFHMSIIYNQFVNHQTPNGLDPVFYKTFQGAIRGENNFKAVELWWYNDPRYNKDLDWVKNKGMENELRIKDENWDKARRLKMVEDGWSPTSPWLEQQIRQANGDMRKIAQEIMCVFGDAIITYRDDNENKIHESTISEFYENVVSLEHKFGDTYFKHNPQYSVLNSNNDFVGFHGITKSKKDIGVKVTLENDKSIIVSEDHIFLANGKNMYVKSLSPNNSYISTIDGDFYVKSVEFVEGCEFYDIIDSENCEYVANGFSNHNCSFLGSGDNFIAEKYLKHIEETQITPPIDQQYLDRNFWIWEHPIVGEEYILSVDVSPGHGDDSSTINILKSHEIIDEQVVTQNGVSKKVKIKKQKSEQVAEYYGKVTPQVLAEIIYQFGKRYNDGYVVIDITGGYGAQTVEKLIEIGYEKIHYAEVSHKPSRDRLAGYIKKGNKQMPDGTMIQVDLIPGFFIGNNRGSLLLEMQRAIHMGDVIIRSIRLLNELKTFINIAGNRVADHKRSFHDDSIIGLAIALYTLSFEMSRFNYSKTSTKKMLDAMININDPIKMAEKGVQLEGLNKEGNKRMPSNRISNPDLQRYIAHSWLFDGLKGK
jgi:hypothetical protein